MNNRFMTQRCRGTNNSNEFDTGFSLEFSAGLYLKTDTSSNNRTQKKQHDENKTAIVIPECFCRESSDFKQPTITHLKTPPHLRTSAPNILALRQLPHAI